MSPIDGSARGLSENIYLFGSGTIQGGAIAILGYAAEIELKKSKSGLQGTRNAFSFISLVTRRVAMWGWSQSLAIGQSLHLISILLGLASLGWARKGFL